MKRSLTAGSRSTKRGITFLRTPLRNRNDRKADIASRGKQDVEGCEEREKCQKEPGCRGEKPAWELT